MLRDKLINLISETLSIDKTFICEDTNLRLLCVLSNHQERLDYVDIKKLKINGEGLKKKTLENITYNNNYLFTDISFLFESNEKKSVIYKDRRGSDSFYNFQILEVLLILEIENKFDIQIPDHQAENIATVGQAISYIKNSK